MIMQVWWTSRRATPQQKLDSSTRETRSWPSPLARHLPRIKHQTLCWVQHINTNRKPQNCHHQACHTAAEDGILDAKDTQLAFSSALAQDCGPKVPDFHFESMYQHYESMYQLMHYASMVQYYESMN